MQPFSGPYLNTSQVCMFGEAGWILLFPPQERMTSQQV